jgi:fumarate reductase iron-sulfur subunit
VEDLGDVPLLARREIEARIAGPLIKAFVQAFGRERTLEIAEKVFHDIAKQKGAFLREQFGGDSLDHFADGYLFRVCEGVKVADSATLSVEKEDMKPEKGRNVFWCEEGAIKVELLERKPGKLSIDVLACSFRDMYRDLGLTEFGYMLSCSRDFPMVEGFNPKIIMHRTQTIMEGAKTCDFRFELRKEE